MLIDAILDAGLPWIIRGAGLFWLISAFLLFRQIRAEMLLDRALARVARETRDQEAAEARRQQKRLEISEHKIDEKIDTAWTDRDNAARRGWIAGQAVVLAATALAMLMLHSFAAWLAALLVLGQGLYFIWRENALREAPSRKTAAHARPSHATVTAGWVSLGIATVVWLGEYLGHLNW